MGANEHIPKTVYQVTLGPQLEYSSLTWSTTAKSKRQALDKIQNQALFTMTGATKSTPIAFMEKYNLFKKEEMSKSCFRQRSINISQITPCQPELKGTPKIRSSVAALYTKLRSWTRPMQQI
ncbi:hypothetical protein DPMN_027127 [Dreissena polymorpha]|uniref:Uncharacterized protein n=1 Tax=Dreissena polymorpha TaxID=45954 RepID=A0A9D4LSX2_DREPO|nr:hypothetical protein DPMN_027127 [Dreissena polymorpha]